VQAAARLSPRPFGPAAIACGACAFVARQPFDALCRFRIRSLSHCGKAAPRDDEARRGALLAQVELFAEVVADLHDHRDTFWIARLGDGRLVGRGTEFPAIPSETYLPSLHS
jgi:hypothetical protein